MHKFENIIGICIFSRKILVYASFMTLDKGTLRNNWKLMTSIFPYFGTACKVYRQKNCTI